jgi:glycosyltransferase involved in cell wall biosynthesis
MTPKVSVIIPTYNRAHLLPKAIGSVLAQTFGDFELIVVDDGSTDDTAAVVERLEDERVSYIWQENQERSAARNHGLRLSRGEYVTFLDADDRFFPDKLARQVRFLDKHPDVDMVMSGWVYEDETGTVIRKVAPWRRTGELDLRAWLFDQTTHVAAMLIRREWLEKVGGFDVNFSVVEDTDLWFRLALAGFRTAWLEAYVFAQRVHSDNTMYDGARMKRGRIALLDKVFVAEPELPARLGMSQEQTYALSYLGSACLEYGVGRIEEAQLDLVRAVELDPDLLEDGGKPVVQAIIGWVLHPMIGDPIAYVRRAFANFPERLSVLRKHQDWAIGKAWAALAFDAHKMQDVARVRRTALRAIVADPSWLLNRGIVSILLESVVGGRVMALIRRRSPLQAATEVPAGSSSLA